ncbi:FtsX-like permease family protein [Cohnella sp. CFH 77786]|uniref:ABC transporter permease n=1 Tax=Cohnella sp. CFH 77786 TaxID=2662265 RepID=UPI001C60954C|nr:FtsX-like permease family protein [Cohnella sp. CFH 77786]MBW5449214.1 FtsX-like permease family protein [Cohnella sp. CFH 77786]
MNNKLYGRLAVTHLKKNASMMLPYLITCIILISLYYIVSSLSADAALKTVPGGNAVVDFMKFGNRLFAVLAVLFLLYANSYIMKRRKKELGLYHILGLEKKHIHKVLLIESAICSMGSIACGLIIGMAVHPFVTAGLPRMLGTELPCTERWLIPRQGECSGCPYRKRTYAIRFPRPWRKRPRFCKVPPF